MAAFGLLGAVNGRKVRCDGQDEIKWWGHLENDVTHWHVSEAADKGGAQSRCHLPVTWAEYVSVHQPLIVCLYQTRMGRLLGAASHGVVATGSIKWNSTSF